MKTLRLFKVVPAALVMILASTEANLAQVPPLQIHNKPASDPLVLSGKSGGAVKSDCGNLAATPNQIIEVTEALPYLRMTVEGEGKPTLLIIGPGGRFCVLADTYTGGKPELSGYWQIGRYSVFVGNLVQGQYNYNLSISQQKLSPRSKMKRAGGAG